MTWACAGGPGAATVDPLGPGVHDVELGVDRHGEARTARVIWPRGEVRGALWIFHGGRNQGLDEMAQRWRDHRDRGWVLVFPQGQRQRPDEGAWFTPVGGTVEQEVDVRLLSATNAALRQLVHDGRFREDLMYRLRVVVLYLPRLVDRTGDLEALTWHFVDQFNARGGRRVHALSAEAWAHMAGYAWPGNVRELQNNLEQAFVLGEGPVIEAHELAPELRGEGPESLHASEPDDHGKTLEDLQRDALLDAFRVTGGHRGQMAERLGISRPTLYRRLKKHGLI